MELQAGLLRDVAIFGGLSTETLKFILDRSARVRRTSGEPFIIEGETGKSFFILEQGRVKVHKDADGDAIDLCEFGPGDAFGEMSLLAVRPRSATIEAIEDCVAIEVTNTSLFALYEVNAAEFSMLVMNLGREVARRLWETNERLFAMSRANNT